MIYKGIAASPGIGIGQAQLYLPQELVVEKQEMGVEQIGEELARLEAALLLTGEQLVQLQEKLRQEAGDEEAEIFEAHQLILQDPLLRGQVEQWVQEERINVEFAVQQVIQKQAAQMEALADEYFQARAQDIRDVGERLVRNLLGREELLTELFNKVVLVARDLTPSDTAQLDKEKVWGMAMDLGSRTSHTAIMARTLQIPAVLGLKNLTTQIQDGDLLIIDGYQGQVLVNPNEEDLVRYQQMVQEDQNRKEQLVKYKEVFAKTKDGKRIEVSANIGTSADLTGVLEQGAEGIGLYRTEFLYMNSLQLPSEEDQFEAYREVAQRMADLPVVIRTLDIGGDKELPYLQLPEEMNPFLGKRAIRLCLDELEIFKTQLRAILRASVFGKVKMMFPMISSLKELRQVKEILHQVQEELRAEGITFDEEMEIGMMMEVPAAAVMSYELAREVDFFSIGTNDLIQYTLAVDRMNEHVADLYQPTHPAILRLIKMIADGAHQAGIWVGVCGEMAGDAQLTALLLGLGIDELSMSASSVLPVKEQVCQINIAEAQQLAKQVLHLETAQEIEEMIKQTK